MVDHQFADVELAALYDAFCAGREDFDFYLPLVMSARAVLDVGCGTGELLHRAREAGHTGRLCGLDPAEGMLVQARKRSGVEFVHGDLCSVAWDGEFDLVVMTGHAFQVLLGDDELRAALAAVRAALEPGGRFVFETRNPLARAWERWTPDRAVEITDPSGATFRMAHEVEQPVTDDLVTFTATYTSSRWTGPRQSTSTLRFLDADTLSAFLAGAGLSTVEQYGDWAGGPLTDTSPEIISVTCRARTGVPGSPAGPR